MLCSYYNVVFNAYLSTVPSGHDHMVGGYTTTCAFNADHQ
jgi:hypothetical protein